MVFRRTVKACPIYQVQGCILSKVALHVTEVKHLFQRKVSSNCGQAPTEGILSREKKTLGEPDWIISCCGIGK